MAFTFLTVSFCYERRLKNGKVGFRIPVYYGFKGGGIAGVGTCISGMGVYYVSDGQNYFYTNFHKNIPAAETNGSAFATGINPRIYLFKRRRTRAFIGPELTIGYSTGKEYYLNTFNGYVERDGTFAAVAKAGFMFHPSDWFHICIDGGGGEGCQFGKPNPLGWAGLWHAGIAMGVNF